MPSRDTLGQEADAMKRYAITLTRNMDDADDLVQDCMERALRKWTLRAAGVPLRGWLFTMMRNLHVDRWRRQKRQAASQGGPESTAPVLPPNQDDHVEGFTYGEAAKTLGVPEGTVLSRVSRARAALRAATGDAAPKLRSVK